VAVLETASVPLELVDQVAAETAAHLMVQVLRLEA
jgi:hypothetical protein